MDPQIVSFDAPPKAYSRGRPDYPSQLLGVLRSALLLDDGAPVIELGAGTGKFTKLLVDARLSVKAVEPLASMLEELGRLPVIGLQGCAEAIPADQGSADAVFAAQAFHWFDYPTALPEIHRVLRPRGRLCLVWNRRIEDERWHREYNAIIDPYREQGKTFETVEWRGALETSGLFGELRSRTLEHCQDLTASAVLDRVRSLGYIASLPLTQQQEILERIRQVLPPTNSTLRIPYITSMYWCSRR